MSRCQMSHRPLEPSSPGCGSPAWRDPPAPDAPSGSSADPAARWRLLGPACSSSSGSRLRFPSAASEGPASSLPSKSPVPAARGSDSAPQLPWPGAVDPGPLQRTAASGRTSSGRWPARFPRWCPGLAQGTRGMASSRSGPSLTGSWSPADQHPVARHHLLAPVGGDHAAGLRPRAVRHCVHRGAGRDHRARRAGQPAPAPRPPRHTPRGSPTAPAAGPA